MWKIEWKIANLKLKIDITVLQGPYLSHKDALKEVLSTPRMDQSFIFFGRIRKIDMTRTRLELGLDANGVDYNNYIAKRHSDSVMRDRQRAVEQNGEFVKNE